MCDVSLGVDACAAGHECHSKDDQRHRAILGEVPTGTCRPVGRRSGEGQLCNTSHDADACVDGCMCLGANGRDVGRGSIGYCARSSNVHRHGGGSGWYRSDASNQCVDDGNDRAWNEIYGSAKQCCEQALWWISKTQCAPGYYR